MLDTLRRGRRGRLDAEEAQAWLRALNDVRLALGARLDITEDDEEQMADADWDDPRKAYRGLRLARPTSRTAWSARCG